MSKIKIFELFAGIGAPRKALSKLGIEYESLGFSEINTNAINCYCKIHGDTEASNYGSIVDIKELPNGIDMLFHGSPCQDFSVAGKNKGGDVASGTRSSLMYETLRLVEKSLPKAVIWENVKGLLSENHSHNFENYINNMNYLGYTSSYQVLNSLDFGIPQSRERVFVISQLNGEVFNFDKLERTEYPLLKEFIATSSMIDVTDKVLAYNNKFNSIKLNRISLLEHLNKQSVSTSGVRKGLIYRYNTTDRFRSIHTFINTLTVTGIHEVKILSKKAIYELGPLNALRLMGFSDDDYHKLEGVLKNNIYKVCGNSIVVDVLEEIFKQLFLNKKEIKKESNMEVITFKEVETLKEKAQKIDINTGDKKSLIGLEKELKESVKLLIGELKVAVESEFKPWIDKLDALRDLEKQEKQRQLQSALFIFNTEWKLAKIKGINPENFINKYKTATKMSDGERTNLTRAGLAEVKATVINLKDLGIDETIINIYKDTLDLNDTNITDVNITFKPMSIKNATSIFNYLDKLGVEYTKDKE